MKKRLLITSIVMMLVVAVALSTATYAWFTSNASVSASSMTLTASTSDEAALGIGWTGSAAGTSITSAIDEELSPMAPTALTVSSTTSEALKFYTSTTKQVAGVYKFNTTPGVGEDEVDPVTYNNGSNVSSFYVRNLSNANTINTVTVKPVFGETPSDGDDMVRVAIFTKRYSLVESGTYSEGTYYGYNSTTNVMEQKTLSAGDSLVGLFTVSGADHVLLGVLGNDATDFNAVGENDTFDLNKVYFVRSGESNNYTYAQTAIDSTSFATYKAAGTLFTAVNTTAYGSIAANGAVNALSYYTSVAEVLTVATALKPGEQVDIVAYAWLDGTMLDDTRAEDVGVVSLLFEAA